MPFEPNMDGDVPQVAPMAFVHPTATLIGHVIIEEKVFIGPHAVLRADEPGPDGAISPIVVHHHANVQDHAIVHALGGTGVTIGPRSSLAHAAIVHGPCQIGADCFIGFGSVVFSATLGDGVVVMHRALVEHATIASKLHLPSMMGVRNEEEAKQLTPATADMTTFASKVTKVNNVLAIAGLSSQVKR